MRPPHPVSIWKLDAIPFFNNGGMPVSELPVETANKMIADFVIWLHHQRHDITEGFLVFLAGKADVEVRFAQSFSSEVRFAQSFSSGEGDVFRAAEVRFAQSFSSGEGDVFRARHSCPGRATDCLACDLCDSLGASVLSPGISSCPNVGVVSFALATTCRDAKQKQKFLGCARGRDAHHELADRIHSVAFGSSSFWALRGERPRLAFLSSAPCLHLTAVLFSPRCSCLKLGTTALLPLNLHPRRESASNIPLSVQYGRPAILPSRSAIRPEIRRAMRPEVLPLMLRRLADSVWGSPR